MALRPLLKTKIDELFLMWLSEPENQALLKTNFRQLLKGEPLTRAQSSFLQSSIGVKPGNSIHTKQQSPRLRPSSPQAPPCSPSLASPRSPRPRSLGAKSSSWQPGLGHHKVNASKITGGNSNEKRESINVENHSVRDAEQPSFLRQKKDELGQKRQEKQIIKEKEPVSVSTQRPDVGNIVVTSTVVSVDAVPIPQVENINTIIANKEPAKKFDIITIEDKNVLTSTPSNTQQKIKHTAAEPVPKVPSAVLVATAASTPVSATVPVSASPSLDSGPILSPGILNRPLPKLSQNHCNIPQFYFPMGCPSEVGTNETLLQRVREEFDKVEGGKVSKAQMGPIVKACGIPLYWKSSFFRYLGGEKTGHVTLQSLLATWKKLMSTCFDTASRFVCITAKLGHNYLEFDDFLPLLQDVVDAHPGLKFLQDAPEFHSRYIQTVISRIFYCVNRSWTGRITTQEIRKSNLLATVELLEEEEDINQVVDYFSYEHFYVIYCKFWELDADHDLLISREDLSHHNDHAISSRMIDRIFSGAVTRDLVDGKLSYRDFVWFLISEEDKRHPRSVEYWFRCMDLDGDGIISMYEMEYFYEEQVQKMEILGIETLPFQDCLCQMLDMIRPKEEGKIRLGDLKACPLTPIFFDTFFNLDKYLEHEQKDPFASLRDRDGEEPEMSDWERFAAEEYELLVAEEGANDMQQEDAMYEDDFEPEEPEMEATNVEATQKDSGFSTTKKPTQLLDTMKDDIYDFSSTDIGY